MTLAERIRKHSFVEPNSGCWLWDGASHEDGYGILARPGQSYLAHRASYEAFIGQIPGGLYVCHKCNTPACVNPAHLYAGTQKDNMRDRTMAGRTPASRGERNGRAKIGEPVARRIIELVNSGMAGKSIAKLLGVTKYTVSDIKRGKRWAHLKMAA